MKKALKGKASTIILIFILILVIVIAAILFFKGGFGIGKGNGNGSSNEAVQANAEISTESSDSTETSAETVETQETQYIEITVSENKYIYRNKDYKSEQLDELIDLIASDGLNEDGSPKLDVAITNDNASLNAYENISAALKAKGFNVIDKTEE